MHQHRAPKSFNGIPKKKNSIYWQLVETWNCKKYTHKFTRDCERKWSCYICMQLWEKYLFFCSILYNKFSLKERDKDKRKKRSYIPLVTVSRCSVSFYGTCTSFMSFMDLAGGDNVKLLPLYTIFSLTFVTSKIENVHL